MKIEPKENRAQQSVGGAIAVGLHVLVLAALMAYEPTRSALQAAAPIMVSLINAQRAEPKPEPLEIPKPKPLVKPLPPQPVMLAAPTPAPAVMTAPPPPPEPPPPAPQPLAVAPAAPAPAEVITPPIFNASYLDNPAPSYPILSRRSGEQGRVVLRVLVSAAGTAEEAQIRESSGHARLDDAARTTVLTWRFVPAKRGSQPVPAWVLIPISFRLEG